MPISVRKLHINKQNNSILVIRSINNGYKHESERTFKI